MFFYPWIFSVVSVLIYWLGLNLFSSIRQEATFLLTQSAVFLVFPLIAKEEIRNDQRGYFRVHDDSIYYAVYIVIMGIVISLVNLYLFQEQILETMEDPFIRRIYQMLSYTFIPFAQGGGWIYQSLMVYFLAIVFGGEGSFKDYLTLVGLSYVGFLISAILSLVMNFLIYDFSLFNDDRFLRFTIGKFGEVLTLMLLVFYVYNRETRFNIAKSCLVACLPTGIIILMQIILR